MVLLFHGSLLFWFGSFFFLKGYLPHAAWLHKCDLTVPTFSLLLYFLLNKTP